MSDVTEKMLDDRESLVAVELTEEELEKVNGAEFGCFFPFNNSTAFAVTTAAFTTNNSGVW